MILLTYISILFSVIPLISGILFYRTINSSLKPFFLYSVFLTFTECFVSFYAYTFGDNMFMYPYYGLIQYFFILIVYKYQGVFRRLNWLFFVLMLFGLALFYHDNFYLDPKPLMPLFLMIGSGFICFLLALLFFYQELQFPKADIWKNPVFFMVVSLMFYGLGNVFYFLLFNSALSNIKAFEAISNYHEILNCSFYALNACVFYFTRIWKTAY